MSITRTNSNKQLVDSNYTQTFTAENKADVEDAYIQFAMMEALGPMSETLKTNTNFRDDTWMDGNFRPQNYSVGTTQGQAIVAKLQADWASEVPNYSAHATNLVAEGAADRLPYVNDWISWYNMEEPSTAIKTTYSLSYSNYCSWYALKFDKTTKEVMSKIVLPNDVFVAEYGEPNLGSISLPAWFKGDNGRYFARIHKKDGTYDDHYDIYMHAPIALMKEWIDANSLTFPYDISSVDLKNSLHSWGITVKESTNEIRHIKAYARTFL
tara:strand:- start:421 stop:1224 length:804 start_codon:yes stop_codon:yes gene_type:complete